MIDLALEFQQRGRFGKENLVGIKPDRPRLETAAQGQVSRLGAVDRARLGFKAIGAEVLQEELGLVHIRRDQAKGETAVFLEPIDEFLNLADRNRPARPAREAENEIEFDDRRGGKGGCVGGRRLARDQMTDGQPGPAGDGQIEVRVALLLRMRDVSAYVSERKTKAKVSNRTVNLDVLTLNNCLKAARKEGYLTGKLPSDGWEKLPYKAAPRTLYTKEQIEKICTTAVGQNADGSPKFRKGELLADVLRFLRCSGARITSALATQWSNVNWDRRQVSLTKTKYDRQIVVDFNPELEAHLRDLFTKRQPDSNFLFPGKRMEGSVGSARKTLALVKAEAGLPDFGFHDCRHHFVSLAIMSGVDIRIPV